MPVLSNVITASHIPSETFTEAEPAIAQLTKLYKQQCQFILDHFAKYIAEGLKPNTYVRGYYPSVRFRLHEHRYTDFSLPYGFASEPGVYETTITRPDLFYSYLQEQLSLIIKSHNVEFKVGLSEMPIPLHFCFTEEFTSEVELGLTEPSDLQIRNHFDVPDLTYIDDAIVNGTLKVGPDQYMPLAPFTAPRVDYSLHRLKHYTATSPEHVQRFIIFTNYHFYVKEFCALARQLVQEPESGYTELVEPGDKITNAEGVTGVTPDRVPQMPSYHLKRADGNGISLINIGVGPSNAKTITDHIAVLRPSAWIMLGHCAGLRNTQRLGDYVLAHGYVRDDHVLDKDLPISVPVPALAEIQVALEEAVQQVSGLSGWELKKIMRTGTVASIDNRNWELLDQDELKQHFSQSRAIGLDMESATIAANGFRFRVPYGTLLCVSDKPLHGELKLPGMANSFYKRQVAQHLEIGIRALESLREMPGERLHSRKLRSFIETPFK